MTEADIGEKLWNEAEKILGADLLASSSFQFESAAESGGLQPDSPYFHRPLTGKRYYRLVVNTPGMDRYHFDHTRL